jgi:hypothetical protein
MHCVKCGDYKYSAVDKEYVKTWGVCWDCDNKLWKDGYMSTKEFSEREQKVINIINSK